MSITDKVNETLAEVFKSYLIEETAHMLEQAKLNAKFDAGDKNVVFYLPGLDVVVENVEDGMRISRVEHLQDGKMRVMR